MIKIEIIKSQDKESISTYMFEFDDIKIGYSLGNDIIIRENNWKDCSFQFQVISVGIKVKSEGNIQYFLSNDKKIAGTKVHQKGDTITFGDTTLKIIEYAISTPEVPNILDMYKERLGNEPELANLLNAIETELKELE